MPHDFDSDSPHVSFTHQDKAIDFHVILLLVVMAIMASAAPVCLKRRYRPMRKFILLVGLAYYPIRRLLRMRWSMAMMQEVLRFAPCAL